MNEAVIVAYGRSPIAKANKGSLAKVHPVDYAAEVLQGVLKQLPQLDPKLIDDIIMGCSMPEAKLGLNTAKLIAARAGLPFEVPGQTVNRFCSSGLQSIAIASSMIMSGIQDIIVAGGVESMTTPVLSDTDEFRNKWLEENTDMYLSMGLTAENVADKYNISRLEMDQMAVDSNRRTAEAVETGKYEKEIIPVKGIDKEGNEFKFTTDECYRKGTNLQTLATLKTVFKENGSVTAATSSQRSDGAAMVVLMSNKRAEKLGIKPLAKFVGFSVVGVDPAIMGIGPIKAVPKVMELTGLNLESMDVIELNEAFASQSIAVMKILGMDWEKVNPNGGALAMGHPLGATGAILTCKAISELERIDGKYGLITMCIGGGMGAAGIIERLK